MCIRDSKDGIFKRRHDLEEKLRDPSRAAAYMLNVFFSFCEEYSVQRCLDIVANPQILDDIYGSSLVKDSEAFIKRMLDVEKIDTIDLEEECLNVASALILQGRLILT
eukprot:3730472-Karenia_brevis.AAC.1